MATIDFDSHLATICERLKELSRLKHVEEGMSALQEDMHYLRIELSKILPGISRKGSSFEGGGGADDASLRQKRALRRRTASSNLDESAPSRTRNIPQFPSEGSRLQHPSEEGCLEGVPLKRNGSNEIYSKLHWEAPQFPSEGWVVGSELLDNDRATPHASPKVAHFLRENTDPEMQDALKKPEKGALSEEVGFKCIPETRTQDSEICPLRANAQRKRSASIGSDGMSLEGVSLNFEGKSSDAHINADRRSRRFTVTASEPLSATASELLSRNESESDWWRRSKSVAMHSFLRKSYRCRPRILHPDSFARSIWDFASCLALAFDSIMIPYVLAWSPDTEGFILFSMIFTAVFWSVDIFATLSTGYFTSDGDLEISLVKIFRRYMQRTLVLDTFICTTDWLGIIAEYGARKSGGSDSNQTWSLLRLVKINRIFRLVSVLRVSRLWDRIERFKSHSLSNTWQVLARILAIFLFILWINHILCCIWYAVGAHGSQDTGASWLDLEVNSENPMTINDSSGLYQYTTAFHWTISQLTPGSMQVNAMNSFERIVNICYLLFGLLFVTSLVARMSALMVQLQLTNREQVEIMRLLRFFLRQKSVSAPVAQRIEKHIISQLRMVRTLTINDIPALCMLSKALRTDLKCDLYADLLLRQPVLRCLLTNMFSLGENRELKSVCDAMECIQLTPGEELFSKGEVTRKSYFLVQGCLLYDVNNLELTELEEVSTPSSWICSAALWMNWETRGYLEADSTCELACLDGSKVLSIVSAQHQRLASLVKHYQHNFVRLLKDVPQADTSDLQEVVDHALVVLYLPDANKQEICKPLLEGVRHRRWFWGNAQEQAMKDLEAEVAKGRSALIPSQDGSPVRVALVTALCIYRPDGEMLVQVMVIKGSQFSFVCRLPGTKTTSSETPSASAKRLMNEVLESIRHDSEDISRPVPRSSDVEKSASPTYGLMTQYNRTVFVARQENTTKPCPPRIQFEVYDTSAAQSRSNGLRRQSSHEMEAQELDEHALLDSLAVRMPWLESHFKEHVHIALTPGGKGSVYAWIYPDELPEMQRILKQTHECRAFGLSGAFMGASQTL